MILKITRKMTTLAIISSSSCFTDSNESSDERDWLSSQMRINETKILAKPVMRCKIDTYAVTGNLNVAISKLIGRFSFLKIRFSSNCIASYQKSLYQSLLGALKLRPLGSLIIMASIIRR
jgi:hypothetical protein